MARTRQKIALLLSFVIASIFTYFGNFLQSEVVNLASVSLPNSTTNEFHHRTLLSNDQKTEFDDNSNKVEKSLFLNESMIHKLLSDGQAQKRRRKREVKDLNFAWKINVNVSLFQNYLKSTTDTSSDFLGAIISVEETQFERSLASFDKTCNSIDRFLAKVFEKKLFELDEDDFYDPYVEILSPDEILAETLTERQRNCLTFLRRHQDLSAKKIKSITQSEDDSNGSTKVTSDLKAMEKTFVSISEPVNNSKFKWRLNIVVKQPVNSFDPRSGNDIPTIGHQSIKINSTLAVNLLIAASNFKEPLFGYDISYAAADDLVTELYGHNLHVLEKSQMNVTNNVGDKDVDELINELFRTSLNKTEMKRSDIEVSPNHDDEIKTSQSSRQAKFLQGIRDFLGGNRRTSTKAPQSVTAISSAEDVSTPAQSTNTDSSNEENSSIETTNVVTPENTVSGIDTTLLNTVTGSTFADQQTSPTTGIALQNDLIENGKDDNETTLSDTIPLNTTSQSIFIGSAVSVDSSVTNSILMPLSTISNDVDLITDVTDVGTDKQGKSQLDTTESSEGEIALSRNTSIINVPVTTPSVIMEKHIFLNDTESSNNENVPRDVKTVSREPNEVTTILNSALVALSADEKTTTSQSKDYDEDIENSVKEGGTNDITVIAKADSNASSIDSRNKLDLKSGLTDTVSENISNSDVELFTEIKSNDSFIKGNLSAFNFDSTEISIPTEEVLTTFKADILNPLVSGITEDIIGKSNLETSETFTDEVLTFKITSEPSMTTIHSVENDERMITDEVLTIIIPLEPSMTTIHPLENDERMITDEVLTIKIPSEPSITTIQSVENDERMFSSTRSSKKDSVRNGEETNLEFQESKESSTLLSAVEVSLSADEETSDLIIEKENPVELNTIDNRAGIIDVSVNGNTSSVGMKNGVNLERRVTDAFSENITQPAITSFIGTEIINTNSNGLSSISTDTLEENETTLFEKFSKVTDVTPGVSNITENIVRKTHLEASEAVSTTIVIPLKNTATTDQSKDNQGKIFFPIRSGSSNKENPPRVEITTAELNDKVVVSPNTVAVSFSDEHVTRPTKDVMELTTESSLTGSRDTTVNVAVNVNAGILDLNNQVNIQRGITETTVVKSPSVNTLKGDKEISSPSDELSSFCNVLLERIQISPKLNEFSFDAKNGENKIHGTNLTDQNQNIKFFSSWLDRITGENVTSNSERKLRAFINNHEDKRKLRFRNSAGPANTDSQTIIPDIKCETFFRDVLSGSIAEPNLFDVLSNLTLFNALDTENGSNKTEVNGLRSNVEKTTLQNVDSRDTSATSAPELDVLFKNLAIFEATIKANKRKLNDTLEPSARNNPDRTIPENSAENLNNIFKEHALFEKFINDKNKTNGKRIISTVFLVGNGNGSLFGNSTGDINLLPELEKNIPVLSPNAPKRGRGMRRLDLPQPEWSEPNSIENTPSDPMDLTAHSLPTDESSSSTNSNGNSLSTPSVIKNKGRFHPKQNNKRHRSCTISAECNDALNEKCLYFGNRVPPRNEPKRACGCPTSYVRHPVTSKCGAATWIETSIKLPHEDFHNDLNYRSSSHFQRKRRDAIETMQLILNYNAELLPLSELSDVDVSHFENGSLVVHWKFVFAALNPDLLDSTVRLLDSNLKEAFNNSTLKRKAALNLRDAKVIDIVPTTNPCEMNYCSEHADCNPDDFHAFKCRCREGFIDESVLYSGEICTKICPSSFCSEHGQCRLKQNGDKHCLCSWWYIGYQCQYSGIVVLASSAGVACFIFVGLLVTVFLCSMRKYKSYDANQVQFNPERTFTSYFSPKSQLAVPNVKNSKFIKFSTPLQNIPTLHVTSPSVGSISYDSTFDVTPSTGNPRASVNV